MWCTAQNTSRTIFPTLTSPHVLFAIHVVLTLPSVATFPAVCVATQVDGLSHVVHSEEEALGTRITIDSLTCLLANESDPSRLIASSPGKLIRYLLPDGSHVETDQPYAEVEVSCWKTHAVHADITISYCCESHVKDPRAIAKLNLSCRQAHTVHGESMILTAMCVRK